MSTISETGFTSPIRDYYCIPCSLPLSKEEYWNHPSNHFIVVSSRKYREIQERLEALEEEG